MGNMIACQKAARELHTWLEQQNLPDGYRITDAMDSHCFRVVNDRGDGISVAYPPDAMGNREMDGPVPSTIETMLIRSNELAYDDELDYSDVLRFNSYDELLSEVQRICV